MVRTVNVEIFWNVLPLRFSALLPIVTLFSMKIFSMKRQDKVLKQVEQGQAASYHDWEPILFKSDRSRRDVILISPPFFSRFPSLFFLFFSGNTVKTALVSPPHQRHGDFRFHDLKEPKFLFFSPTSSLSRLAFSLFNSLWQCFDNSAVFQEFQSTRKVGLGISRTHADSQWNSSLQGISWNSSLWKRNSSSVVMETQILTQQTSFHLSIMSPGSKRRALAFYFCVQICHMFSISKYRKESDLGLCTISVLANRMPPQIGKFRRILQPNTFFSRKSPPLSGMLFASTEVVHRPRSDSHLHFDIRNMQQFRLRTLERISGKSVLNRKLFLSMYGEHPMDRVGHAYIIYLYRRWIMNCVAGNLILEGNDNVTARRRRCLCRTQIKSWLGPRGLGAPSQSPYRDNLFCSQYPAIDKLWKLEQVSGKSVPNSKLFPPTYVQQPNKREGPKKPSRTVADLVHWPTR